MDIIYQNNMLGISEPYRKQEHFKVKLPKPAKLIRTTLGEYLANPYTNDAGIYVLACYPTFGVLYIGLSRNIQQRLVEHPESQRQNIDRFLIRCMGSACGFRLDILTCPEVKDQKEWMKVTEKRMIQYFRPTFNTKELGEQCD